MVLLPPQPCVSDPICNRWWFGSIEREKDRKESESPPTQRRKSRHRCRNEFRSHTKSLLLVSPPPHRQDKHSEQYFFSSFELEAPLFFCILSILAECRGYFRSKRQRPFSRTQINEAEEVGRSQIPISRRFVTQYFPDSPSYSLTSSGHSSLK